MKKVILAVAMVFATGSMLNASTNIDENIEAESIVKFEEKSCIRDCVDMAIVESTDESWGMMRISRMDAYHELVNNCYSNNC